MFFYLRITKKALKTGSYANWLYLQKSNKPEFNFYYYYYMLPYDTE